MALALKDQFQITIVPAYAAADGKRFHDAAEAQAYTRDNMLNSVIAAACKDRPDYARLDPTLLREFLLLTGRSVGAIMAEPLTPVQRQPAVAVTNTPRAGESEDQTAARLRQAVDASRSPAPSPMPRAVNPDIFQNRHPALQAADAVDRSDGALKGMEEAVNAELRAAGIAR